MISMHILTLLFPLALILYSVPVVQGCPGVSKKFDIVFVMHLAPSGLQCAEQKQFAINFIRSIESVSYASKYRVAVMWFANEETVLFNLTKYQDITYYWTFIIELIVCWRTCDPCTQSDIAGALDTANSLLDPDSTDFAAVVLLSNGHGTAADRVAASAAQLMANGAAGYAVCVGDGDCNSSILQLVTGGDETRVFDLREGVTRALRSFLVQFCKHLSLYTKVECLTSFTGFDYFHPGHGRAIYPDQPMPTVDDEPECGFEIPTNVHSSNDFRITADISRDFRTLTIKEKTLSVSVEYPALEVTFRQIPYTVTNFTFRSSDKFHDVISISFTSSTITVRRQKCGTQTVTDEVATSVFDITLEPCTFTSMMENNIAYHYLYNTITCAANDCSKTACTCSIPEGHVLPWSPNQCLDNRSVAAAMINGTCLVEKSILGPILLACKNRVVTTSLFESRGQIPNLKSIACPKLDTTTYRFACP